MNENQQNTGMDDFTRKYLYVLLALALAGCIWWLGGLDSKVSTLNKALKADDELANYSYQFRAISLKDGVAQISSPRSPDMPAIQSLRIMFPELQHSSVASEEVMAAQDELARMQKRAGALVESQDGVKTIRWVLDQKWFAKHGVFVD